MVKYPHVTVKLSGKTNTFFGAISDVRDALSAAGISEDEIDQFTGDAVWADGTHAGDPKKMLELVAQWVTVE